MNERDMLNEIGERYGVTPDRLARVASELWSTVELYEQNEVLATYKLLELGYSPSMGKGFGR